MRGKVQNERDQIPRAEKENDHRRIVFDVLTEGYGLADLAAAVSSVSWSATSRIRNAMDCDISFKLISLLDPVYKRVGYPRVLLEDENNMLKMLLIVVS